jgi:hypothetical protein
MATAHADLRWVSLDGRRASYVLLRMYPLEHLLTTFCIYFCLKIPAKKFAWYHQCMWSTALAQFGQKQTRTRRICRWLGTWKRPVLWSQVLKWVLGLCYVGRFLKDYVICQGTAPRHTTTYSSGTFPEDEPFDLDGWRERFKIKILEISEDDVRQHSTLAERLLIVQRVRKSIIHAEKHMYVPRPDQSRCDILSFVCVCVCVCVCMCECALASPCASALFCDRLWYLETKPAFLSLSVVIIGAFEKLACSAVWRYSGLQSAPTSRAWKGPSHMSIIIVIVIIIIIIIINLYTQDQKQSRGGKLERQSWCMY